jgi:phospholipid transport system substrate-binding protein
MFKRWMTMVIASLALAAGVARAEPAPDFIGKISTEVIEFVKADKAIQAGDTQKIIQLVDAKILPHVNFRRMTASTVGPAWRKATPEQQQRLQEEFKVLLVRTYAGALSQVKDQSVELKPFRGKAEDADVVVRTEVKGSGQPIQLDYRMEKDGEAWKIYDVNVLGVWLVSSYRSSFSQEINAGGLDGLISKLAEKNKSAGNKS